jgi:hypothetical protein
MTGSFERVGPPGTPARRTTASNARGPGAMKQSRKASDGQSRSVSRPCEPTGCGPAGSDLWGRLSLNGQRTSCRRFIDPQFLSSPALAHCSAVQDKAATSFLPSTQGPLVNIHHIHQEIVPPPQPDPTIAIDLQTTAVFLPSHTPRNFSGVHPANGPTAYRIFEAAQQMRPRRRPPVTRANLRDMLGCPTRANEQQLTTRPAA